MARLKHAGGIESTAGSLRADQGTADDEALVLESTGDVAHGMTDLTETSTFFAVKKAQTTSGGAQVSGYKDADGIAGSALVLDGVLGEAADTTKSTSAAGVVVLDASVKSGATSAPVGADGNLAVIRNGGATTRFIFDAEGSAHGDVEWIAF